jgi:hypothetical protein
MSDQPHQDTLHFLNTHVYILNHSPVQHPRRHIPPPTFLLQVIETLKDNAFTLGETVFHIREIVTRVTARHMKVSPRRVYPEFCADPASLALSWGRASVPTLFAYNILLVFEGKSDASHPNQFYGTLCEKAIVSSNRHKAASRPSNTEAVIRPNRESRESPFFPFYYSALAI